MGNLRIEALCRASHAATAATTIYLVRSGFQYGGLPCTTSERRHGFTLAWEGQERWPWEPLLLAEDTAQISEMLWMPGCGGPTGFKSLESLLRAL